MMQIEFHSTDSAVSAAVAAGASKVTYTGASVTIGGWLLSSEFAVLFGMMLALGGFIVNWYYKHRLTLSEVGYRYQQNERERIEHEHRIAVLNKL